MPHGHWSSLRFVSRIADSVAVAANKNTIFCCWFIVNGGVVAVAAAVAVVVVAVAVAVVVVVVVVAVAVAVAVVVD